MKKFSSVFSCFHTDIMNKYISPVQQKISRKHIFSEKLHHYSHLMKQFFFLNGSWIDENSVVRTIHRSWTHDSSFSLCRPIHCEGGNIRGKFPNTLFVL